MKFSRKNDKGVATSIMKRLSCPVSRDAKLKDSLFKCSKVLVQHTLESPIELNEHLCWDIALGNHRSTTNDWIMVDRKTRKTGTVLSHQINQKETIYQNYSPPAHYSTHLLFSDSSSSGKDSP